MWSSECISYYPRRIFLHDVFSILISSYRNGSSIQIYSRHLPFYLSSSQITYPFFVIIYLDIIIYLDYLFSLLTINLPIIFFISKYHPILFANTFLLLLPFVPLSITISAIVFAVCSFVKCKQNPVFLRSPSNYFLFLTHAD